MSLQNPVKTLPPETARKIAAGEVIDRPNAIVRELMDNAIDSGADFITVEIAGGGIEKIRVVDNGCGMTQEDLKNCAHPHATSKISSDSDLLKISTLGFRGEALASIAAVARLSIISGGWKMRASIIEDHILERTAEVQGTIVQSEGLFENIPARRQFLKRPATEGIMCRNTFIEKAMARPDIGFRFISDGMTKLDLPAGQSLKERYINANQITDSPALFYELSGKAAGSVPDWSFKVLIGEPSVSRPNKKDILIYANGRRIQEYSLVQAVDYGGQGFFPNGTFPAAVVFVEVKPSLIDFNIHPAKKEARFHDISELHHGISSTIKEFFHSYTLSNFKEDKPADEVRYDTIGELYQNHISYKTSETTSQTLSDFRSKYFGVTSGGVRPSGVSSGSSSSRNASSGSVRTESPKPLNTEVLAEQALNNTSPQIKFIGSTLGTFLLAEKNNCLYIIDQHAAHERILFDRIMNSQGNRQPLLIPYKIKTDSKSQDNQLERLKDRLTEIGFETEKKSPREWEIKTIPERWTGTQYDLQTLIFVKQVEPEQIIRSIAAMTACHAAVKDGYVLDDQTAANLVEKAFSLEDPHCPHGRPIYTVISRQKLFELVKRT